MIEPCGEGVTIHAALTRVALQRYNVRRGNEIVRFCYTLQEARMEAAKEVARIKKSQGGASEQEP